MGGYILLLEISTVSGSPAVPGPGYTVGAENATHGGYRGKEPNFTHFGEILK